MVYDWALFQKCGSVVKHKYSHVCHVRLYRIGFRKLTWQRKTGTSCDKTISDIFMRAPEIQLLIIWDQRMSHYLNLSVTYKEEANVCMSYLGTEGKSLMTHALFFPRNKEVEFLPSDLSVIWFHELGNKLYYYHYFHSACYVIRTQVNLWYHMRICLHFVTVIYRVTI